MNDRHENEQNFTNEKELYIKKISLVPFQI